MANYCRVYGVNYFTSPVGWLPVHRDQLRAQRSVTSMGKLYLFLHLHKQLKHPFQPLFDLKFEYYLSVITEPTICRNEYAYKHSNGTPYYLFICPAEHLTPDYNYCCGEPTRETCCRAQDRRYKQLFLYCERISSPCEPVCSYFIPLAILVQYFSV